MMPGCSACDIDAPLDRLIVVPEGAGAGPRLGGAPPSGSKGPGAVAGVLVSSCSGSSL
jgi:hypothetical protein